MRNRHVGMVSHGQASKGLRKENGVFRFRATRSRSAWHLSVVIVVVVITTFTTAACLRIVESRAFLTHQSHPLMVVVERVHSSRLRCQYCAAISCDLPQPCAAVFALCVLFAHGSPLRHRLTMMDVAQQPFLWVAPR